MKKSYIVALIFIGLCVIGMIVYHVVSTYGPGSENAQMKKRVEYALEAYGALNDGSSTWSTYTPTEADLACHVSCKNLCRMFNRGDYETEDEARGELLVGVFYKIDKVEKKEGKYIVTVILTRPDKTKGTTYFVFEKKIGSWEMVPESIEQAVYVGNGIGGNGDLALAGDILDYALSL